jgi:hypothetical protein
LTPPVWTIEGELGALRIARTRDAAKQTDLALLVLTGAPTVEREWAAEFKARSIPALAVLNKSDLLADPEPLRREIEASLGIPTFAVSAADGERRRRAAPRRGRRRAGRFLGSEHHRDAGGKGRSHPAGDAAGFRSAQGPPDRPAGADYPGAAG